MFVSSFSDFSDDMHFDGYAYVDQHFVFGAAGAAAFHKEHGAGIPCGEDGCYVTIYPKDGCTIIGTDHIGNRHLFFYRDGSDWAVSDSLSDLIGQLGRAGKPMTTDLAQLHAFSSGSPFTNQMTSFRTVVREITLVPPWCQLRISNAKAEVVAYRQSLATSLADFDREDYAEALDRFLEIWVARFRTLMRYPGMSLSVDVSGGLDSRAVLAFFLYHGEETLGLSFYTSDQPEHADDMRVAEDLARTFRFRLVHRTECRKGSRLSGTERLQRWKASCLGTYAPIRPYTRDLHMLSVKVGGGGGEMTRPFYDPKGSVPQFLDRLSMRIGFQSPQESEDWKTSVIDTLDILSQQDGRQTDPLVLHYRTFRSRFHTGSRTNLRVTAMPLQSRFLTDVVLAASPEIIRSRKIMFDIMYALKPGLIEVPFCKQSNTLAARDYLPPGPAIVRSLPAGKVYGVAEDSLAHGDTDRPRAGPGFFRMLKKALDSAAPMAGELMAADQIEGARQSMQDNRFRRPKHGTLVHNVILAAELVRNGSLAARS
jgi:hypothetical protein